MSRIEVDKDNLPESFDIDLGADTYTLAFDYNETGDFFTVDLINNDEALVYGEKLMYGRPLFEDVENNDFPAPTIIPLDPSGKETTITFENFGVTVFLEVDDE